MGSKFDFSDKLIQIDNNEEKQLGLKYIEVKTKLVFKIYLLNLYSENDHND